jgi:hypothetical protein
MTLWFFTGQQATTTGSDYYRLTVPARSMGTVSAKPLTVMMGNDLAQVLTAISKADVLVVSRTLTRFAQMHETCKAAVQQWQRAGGKLVVDIDDHWQPPAYSPIALRHHEDGTTAQMLETIEMADVIWTTTGRLGKHILRHIQLQANVPVTRAANALPPMQLMPRVPANDGRLRVGIMAHATNWHNLAAVRHILKYDPSEMQLVLLGVDEKLRAPLAEMLKVPKAMRKQLIHTRPWMAPGAHMEHYRFIDMMLCTHVPDEYNRCRSPLRLAECYATDTPLAHNAPEVYGHQYALDLTGTRITAKEMYHHTTAHVHRALMALPEPPNGTLEDANRWRLRSLGLEVREIEGGVG